MHIATGQKQADGLIYFTVQIPFATPLPVHLEKVVEKRSDKSPDYHVWAGACRCGALWKKTPNQGGPDFLSGTLESALFPTGKIDILIFAAKEPERKGQMDMIWSPPKSDRGSQWQGGRSDDSAPAVSAPRVIDDPDGDDIPF